MTDDEARVEFRRRIAESDRLAALGDAEGANAETDAIATLVGPWERTGELRELLALLLAEAETESVRFGAASYLLSRGHADMAVPTLEDLEGDADSVAALDAGMLLRHWRKQSGTSTG